MATSTVQGYSRAQLLLQVINQTQIEKLGSCRHNRNLLVSNLFVSHLCMMSHRLYQIIEFGIECRRVACWRDVQNSKLLNSVKYRKFDFYRNKNPSHAQQEKSKSISQIFSSRLAHHFSRFLEVCPMINIWKRYDKSLKSYIVFRSLALTSSGCA